MASDEYNTRKPSVGWWKDQIAAGERYRGEAAFEDRWETWRAYYRSQWRDSTLPLNLFFMLLRSLVPRVYFKNPSVSITPAKPGPLNPIFAQLLERADNKMLRAMDIKKHIKLMIQDAFLFGTGFGKLGFGAEFTPSPEGLVTSAPEYPRQGAVEYNKGILPNHPWFSRVHPKYIVLPDGTMNREEARWVCHVVDRPFLDVKDDKRLKNTSDLKPTRTRMAKTGERVFTVGTPVEMVRLYEIRDKKFNQVYVISDLSDKYHYEGPDDLQDQNGWPVFELIFNPDTEYFWGLPDSLVIEPQQLEINEIRTQMMKHRRVTLIKLLLEKGAIDEYELAKMTNEEVMAAVIVNDIQGAKPMQIGQIPDDLRFASEDIRSDVREQVGFSRNQMGELSQKSGDTTATEAAIVQAASEIRVDERQDLVAEMLTRVVRSMHNFMFKFWQQEQVIDIIGPGGIPLWVRFSGEMLKGGAYEVHVEPDSGVPQTRQYREQKALQVYQILKDNPLIDPIGLTRYLLREQHGVEYDTLIRGLPPGIGQTQPMSVGQYAQLRQRAGQLSLPQPRQQGGS